MSRHILGVDGGGTRTRAAILNETGKLLGVGLRGPTNYDDIGIEATRDNLRQAINAAWQDAGFEPQPFAAAFLGLAGIVSEDDHRIIRQITYELNLAPEAQVGIDHDCRIALAGSLSGRAGIVLIAGTGSACYGRTAAGHSWRAGGWGDLLADEGSGGWLGWQALRAAVRSFDGRERPSRLVNDILDLFELRHMDDIMHRIYHVGLSRKERAALAPLVMTAARDNDEIAQQLIHEAVEELALSVWAVAHQLEMHAQPEIAIVGGLYNVEDLFAAPLRTAIRNKLPGCHIQPPELSPVIGACLLALQQIGVDPQRISLALKASEKALKAKLNKRQ
jgi:N-acetylglucosamine kinase-like BadF-type ATPase